MRKPPVSGAASPLEELGRVLGVQLGYESGGVWREASTDSLVAALRSLGAPLAHPADAAEALRAVRTSEAARLAPSTVVCWTDELAELPVQVPFEAATEPVRVELVLEDGSRAARLVDPAEIRWSEEWRTEGRAWRTGRVPLSADLPRGYHEVRTAAAGRTAETVVVRAPRTTWRPPDAEPRRWGTFLPLHALRTRGDGGVGDLSGLRRLSVWTARQGGALVGTLPLYDTFIGPAGPTETSPYAPVSRLFWNPVWAALEEAPGVGGEVGSVDYPAVMARKRAVLEARAEARRDEGPHGPRGPHGLDAELARWVEDDPEALAYARFRAALDAGAPAWSRWDERARGGDDEALDAPDPAVRYHVYAQWLLERQLDELVSGEGAGLYLDLPLGSHPDGFDVWRHQARFARDFTVGAPPDAFFEGGQDWGFPPLHPRRVREDGHRYWSECLGRTMAVCDALRLDHVMSLHRLYWVPAGAGARDGVYVEYPAEELWAVLCLESWRHETEVVGEDLGTVPPEVPRAMERHGARRMWVLPFEVAANDGPGPGAGPDEGPDGYRVNDPTPGSVASLNTHDLPTFAAFVEGADIDARLDEGRLDEAGARDERAHRSAWRTALTELLRDRGHLRDANPGLPALLRAALRFLASSDAGLVLVTLEDLWLETEPQNVPGTPSSENWTRRARLSLEEMTSDEEVRELLTLMDRCRRASHGTPTPPDG